MTLAANRYGPANAAYPPPLAGAGELPHAGGPRALIDRLRPELVRLVRFLLLGGVAAGVNWVSRFGWSLVAPFELAVIVAHATGMAVAFVLFRAFVFPGSPLPAPVQMRNFLVVNLVGMGVAWVTAVGLAKLVFPAVGLTWHAEAIAHGVAVLTPAATSWFGHRHVSFKGGR